MTNNTDKARERLYQFQSFIYANTEGPVYDAVMKFMANTQAEIDKLKAQLEAQKWVSVDERLPPMNEPFDAWNINGFRMANYEPFVGSWDSNFRKEVCRINGITHWKPIEPPKENSDE